MPRHTDLDEELAKLEALVAQDPNATRQYITKLPARLAVTFIKDCISSGLVPGHCLRDIVESHYEQKARGFVDGLPPFAAQVLEALSFQTGGSPSQVITDLLENAGMAKLERISNLRKKLEPEESQPV